jgi:acetyl esterase/lipase
LGSGYQKKSVEDYCSPTRAGGTVHADLSGLPKCLNQIFGCDPLHGMGEAHGKALVAAGVECTTKSYPGQIHGCYIFAQSLMPSALPVLVDGVAALKGM